MAHEEALPLTLICESRYRRWRRDLRHVHQNNAQKELECPTGLHHLIADGSHELRTDVRSTRVVQSRRAYVLRSKRFSIVRLSEYSKLNSRFVCRQKSDHLRRRLWFRLTLRLRVYRSCTGHTELEQAQSLHVKMGANLSFDHRSFLLDARGPLSVNCASQKVMRTLSRTSSKSFLPGIQCVQ